MLQLMRALFSKWIFFGLLGLVACQIPSRSAMDGAGGRTSYNSAIQMTNAQQMLLNLVRLRYADSPLFLDVASVTTQSTFRSELSPVFPIPGFNQDNPFKLGSEILWQDQPTITYTPLEGHAFAERLLRPIDLHTIQLLCYSGWDVDRVFRMTIQHFENLSNATESSGPVPEQMTTYMQFTEASRLLRYFQRRGELQVGLKMKAAKEHVDPEEVGLQISFPEDGEEGSRLATLLGCEKTAVGKYRKEVEIGFDEHGSVGVMPRSILSCMYSLSQGVSVPEEHVDSGIVRTPVCGTEQEQEQDWRSMFCELLAVRWSRFLPKNAFVSIKYHDYWFYIDDCDLASKKTFALLLQLYNLNAIVPKNRGPILSLPLR